MTTDVADPTIRKAVSDAVLEQEMDELLANRPEYREYVPGTEAALEPTRGRALTSTAAILTIYNRETGEPSQVVFDALKARMRQKFPEDYANPKFAGQRVYELEKVNVPAPARGNLACPLSYASPSEEAKEMGFGTGTRGCRKPHYFQTPMDVDDHVRKNHKRFYELREKLREEHKRDEDRALQRQMLAAIAGRVEAKPDALTCECGWTTDKGANSLAAHKRLHCPLKGQGNGD